MVKIDRALKTDYVEVFEVYKSAFSNEQGGEIIDLVRELLEDETAVPILSLVAKFDERVVGHILFTAVQLQSVSAQILAPLAILKEHQRQGIGSLLIYEGMKQLAASGVELVFVLGYPEYYSKFGFQPAGALGYEAPYPIPIAQENAWMVRALKSEVIGSGRGKIRCAATLNQPQHWRE